MPFVGTAVSAAIGWLKHAAAAGSTLLNDLVAYWPLDEVSGTRADAVGSADLTDNNTVGVSLAGPSGTVARLVAANTESFSNATVFDSMAGKSGTFLTWVKQDSVTGAWMFGGTAGGWNSSVEAFVSGTNSKLNIAFYNDDEGKTERDYIEHQNVMLAGWNLIGFTYDHPTKTSTVYVNGVPSNTTSVLSDGLNWDGAPDFQLGGARVIWGAADDQRGPTGLWERAFSTNEVLGIFNSGSGKSYADLTAAEKVGLVSYWNLDEVSGQRNDSHGTNHLTDNNTVGSVNSGPAGTVASFVGANTESLTYSGAVVDATADYTIVGWAKFASLTSDYGILWQLGGYGTHNGILLENEHSGFNRLFNDYGGGSDSIDIGNNVNRWVMYVQKYVGSTNTAYHKALGAVANNDTWSAGQVNDQPATTTFYVGRRANAGSETWLNSQVSSLGAWQRVLSDEEITALFNSGAGKKYADLTAAEKVGLVSYWDLDETSGDRADSHGANTLTDNNTVLSVINAGGAMDGGAASFVAANSEYLSINDNAALSLGSDSAFQFALWFAADNPTTAGASYLIAKWGGGGAGYQQEYTLKFTPDAAHPYFDFAVGDGTTTQGTLQTYPQDIIDHTGGVWHFVTVWHDPDADKLYIQVNGNAPQSTAWAGGTFDGDGKFVLARCGNFDQQYFGGKLDEVAFWSRVLTEDERTELWNAGRGKFYDFSS